MSGKARYIFVSRILPLIAVVALGYALVFTFTQKEKSPAGPSQPPPVSPYEDRVAGIGITEPQSENIAIGTNLPGIVAAIHVAVGNTVAKGDPLFTIDERDARAQLELSKAQLEAAKVQLADARHQLSLYEGVSDKRAISDDELSQRRYAAKLADAKVKEAHAQVSVYNTQIERLTVRAPIDGEILKLNLRLGEYAQAGVLRDPLIIMGNTDVMHVRVEIDETNARHVSENAAAIGTLRGYGNAPVTLRFVRREPYINPKRSLTGDGNERVDTRVLEVIYAFDNKEAQADVGQQMDVFIDAKGK